jgi:hypothetical protein
MDLKSPGLIKLKGLLFLFLGLLSLGLILYPDFELRRLVLCGICIWAFCRFYYFCFYVIQNYVDPAFKYAGLLSVLKYLARTRKQRD